MSMCGIVLENGRDCQAESVEDPGLNLCWTHLREAYEAYRVLGPRRRIEQEELKTCPSCDQVQLFPGDTGQRCVYCGYETPDFTGGDMLDLAAAVPNFKASNASKIKVKRVDVVYYLQFADRIKIGTSNNLRGRLLDIPHDRVLALEPGGRTIEQRRHAEHAHARVRGEWFSQTPELLAHIESLQRPPLGWQGILAELERA